MATNTEPTAPIWTTFTPMGGLALLWSLVLAVGGLVLLAFVATNGFLPELDLPGAISLLASVSLISLFLAFAVLILTVTGGWVIYSWFENRDAKSRGQISMALAMFSATAVYTALAIQSDAPILIRIVAIIVICALALVLIRCGLAGLRWATSSNESVKRLRNGAILVIAVLAISTLFAICHAIVFVHLYQAPPGTSDVGQWAAFGMWLFFQALCIGLIATSRTPAALFKVSGSLGVVSFFLLLALSNNRTYVLTRTARILGIGAMPNVHLVVTLKGCEVLSALSEGRLCTPGPDESVYSVGPVTLRSRFGKQVLIEYTKSPSAPANSKEIALEAVIPATEVLGWQRSHAASNPTGRSAKAKK